MKNQIEIEKTYHQKIIDDSIILGKWRKSFEDNTQIVEFEDKKIYLLEDKETKLIGEFKNLFYIESLKEISFVIHYFKLPEFSPTNSKSSDEYKYCRLSIENNNSRLRGKENNDIVVYERIR